MRELPQARGGVGSQGDEADPEQAANPRLLRVRRLASGRGIDGGALVDALRAQRSPSRLIAHVLPDENEEEIVDELARHFLEWVDGLEVEAHAGSWETRLTRFPLGSVR